jgi:hypothetical protein
VGSNDRSPWEYDPEGGGNPPPADWIVFLFAAVFVALIVFAVLYVRV